MLERLKGIIALPDLFTLPGLSLGNLYGVPGVLQRRVSSICHKTPQLLQPFK